MTPTKSCFLLGDLTSSSTSPLPARAFLFSANMNEASTVTSISMFCAGTFCKIKFEMPF